MLSEAFFAIYRPVQAYKLRTAVGTAIYGARRHTVEPVLGIITGILRFRQFSRLDGVAVMGEPCLVCLAFNFKRFHTVVPVSSPPSGGRPCVPAARPQFLAVCGRLSPLRQECWRFARPNADVERRPF